MSAAMRAVAVTGASGFIGGALCRALAGRGWEVRALVRVPERFAAPAGVRAVRCDLPDTIDEAALAGAAAVVHCAYATRETDLDRARRANEDGTRALLERSRHAGVPRMVFVSTVAAAADAPSYYARSKHALEQLFDPARDAIVRPGLVVGAGGHGLFQQLLDNMRRLRVVPLFGGGRQPLQTVHVDDLCEGITRVLERDLTGAFNIAEPEPPTLGDFLRTMAARLGIRCAFVSLPSRRCSPACARWKRCACRSRFGRRACSGSRDCAAFPSRTTSAASTSAFVPLPTVSPRRWTEADRRLSFGRAPAPHLLAVATR